MKAAPPPGNPENVRAPLSAKSSINQPNCPDLARSIGPDILRYSEARGQQPDNALLAGVARALGNGEAVEEDSAIEALKARIDAIFDAAEKVGALDEDVLAELPSGLAEQLRAAWAATRSGSGTENHGG
jgi:hypothetical protein